MKPPERTNQRYRTRKELITTAARLMREGRKPTLEDVAAAALVSRATAYRYFPNVDALLVEASLDVTVPDGEALFAGEPSGDPEERIDKAEAAVHRSVFDNEILVRMMLASAVTRRTESADGTAGAMVPVRQNRRTPLIEAALAPARGRFDDDTYQLLRAALALVFGSESMIVFRDVLQMDEQTARHVKSWAVRALVRAALAQSRALRKAPRGDRVSRDRTHAERRVARAAARQEPR